MKKRILLCTRLGVPAPELQAYVRTVFEKNGIPLGTQFYQRFITEYNEIKEVETSLLWLCDEVWVFGDALTASMEDTMEKARLLNLNVRRFKLPSSNWEDIE